MISQIEKDRAAQLEKNIANIWKAKRYLYVGANEVRFHFEEQLSKCVAGGAVCDVIEIEGLRCEWLKENKSFIRRVIHEDIAHWSFFTTSFYDIILWSHGPSCFRSLRVLDATLDNLKHLTETLVVMCPWGEYPGPLRKRKINDHNFLSLDRTYFTDRGFKVDALGQKNVAESNLLAWWYRNG